MSSQEEKPPNLQLELHAQSSLQNHRKRRSKNQQTGRDFLCQCGKSYLSYSALYTHSKVKHNSKITLEQSLYTSVNMTKPNRFNFIDEDILEAFDDGQRQHGITDIQNFLHVIKKELKDEFAKMAASKKVKINNVIFLDKHKRYWENREKDDEVMDGTIYLTPIDRALGYLLIKCEKAFKREEFLFFQVFTMRLRSELNEVKNNWRHTETTLSDEFPKEMNEVFINRFKSTDMFKDNPTMNSMLIYHICRWLLRENFTRYLLTLNLTEQP